MLLTILGFLQYTGKIEIDDVDIATIHPDQLRSRIITITQDAVQFDDTIRKNLLPFTMNDDDSKVLDEKETAKKEAKDAMLKSVLEKLNIWSHLAEKGGLDAMIRDVGYSKGEMQLFCIARAVVRRNETDINLVLIDEATSSLDPRRDAATQKVMKEAFDGCTVITIAHRLDTIEDADCTVELSGGRVMRIKRPSKASTSGSESEKQ